MVVKVIGRDTGAPFTSTDPVLGLAVYPATDPTSKERLPLASVKLIEAEEELRRVSFRVTPHEVPIGRPDSAKLTTY